MPLSLEPTDDRADPIFKDASSCKKWLSQLQLTNLQLAHGLLLIQLNEFNSYPIRGTERLDTLELLSDTIHYVQNDYAKKISGKPLPLHENELVILFSLAQLWHAMSHGYLRCLQDCIAGDTKLGKQAALLCQRALMYSSLAINEHFRAGYDFDPKLWLQLHGIYAYAEEQELLYEEVIDPLDKELPPVTCHGEYLKLLLTCYARPTQLTRAQLHMLGSWLPQWINMLTVERSYTASKGDAQPLAFALDSTNGLQSIKMVQPGDTVRYVATMPLSKLLRVKTILLQQGTVPQQVELGELGSNHECIELLTHLHRYWCEERDMRSSERNLSVHKAILFQGLGNIYAQLGGKGYKPPVKTAENNSEARKQIETFGRVLQDAPDKKQIKAEPELETWRIDNESLQGVQLTREGTSGGQLGHNQFVALRHSDTGALMLGVTAWVRVMRTGQLRIGIRYLPGKAEAITLYATVANKGVTDKSVPALQLHAVPELKIPPSLITPRNWFEPAQVAEITHRNGEKQNIKTGFSVERGLDYERVSFVSV